MTNVSTQLKIITNNFTKNNYYYFKLLLIIIIENFKICNNYSNK